MSGPDIVVVVRSKEAKYVTCDKMKSDVLLAVLHNTIST